MAKRTSFNLAGKVFTILSKANGERITARETAKRIVANYPDDCEAKAERSQAVDEGYTVEGQIASEIGSSLKMILKKYPAIQIIETRPREYYVPVESEETEATATVKSVLADSHEEMFSEHDLYPFLGQFVWSDLDCFSMRIDERKSRNARGPKGNMWLYPDIVGMTDLTSNWSNETSALAKATQTELAHLFSFEVKLTINRSNVREVFFQTLSNSSWAHYSYLAASEINRNAMPELRLLCASHGIGLIQIETTDASNSQVLIPARLKDAVDWNLLNRLAEENSDARYFIKAVRDFHLTGETSQRNWDLCPKK